MERLEIVQLQEDYVKSALNEAEWLCSSLPPPQRETTSISKLATSAAVHPPPQLKV